jgi:hypothetical protein
MNEIGKAIARYLRSTLGLLLLISGCWIVACHKDAPPQPAPAEHKKSPAELEALSSSTKQSLARLRPLVSALNMKFETLRPQFAQLPADLPDFGELRGKFYAAEEGLGRMNAKIPWLSARIEAATNAGDSVELEDISKSIARSYDEIPQAEQIAMELFHQVMPFKRMAADLEHSSAAECALTKTSAAATLAAAKQANR